MRRLMGSRVGSLLLFVIIMSLGIFLLRNIGPSFEMVSMSTLAGQVKSGEVDRLLLDMDEVEVMYRDGSLASAQMEPYMSVVDHLYSAGLTDEDLESLSLHIEIKQTSIFNQKLFLGVPIGGFMGLLIVATLMMLNLHSRTKKPTIYL